MCMRNCWLIPHGPVSRTWQSNVSCSCAKLDHRVFETIGKLCGCDLENIDGGRAVMIKGDSSQEDLYTCKRNYWLIPYGPVCWAWQSSVSNSCTKLDHPVFETIGKLCGCDLAKIDGGRAVMIKGESSQEDLHTCKRNCGLIPYGPVCWIWQSSVSNSCTKLDHPVFETIGKLCGCDLENLDGGREVMIQGRVARKIFTHVPVCRTWQSNVSNSCTKLDQLVFETISKLCDCYLENIDGGRARMIKGESTGSR